ncbi:hypothetical protein CDAR_123241 [Caerostris darwini]|uniref:Uncharacterized protein n=1 Tax=Caerostris darwini TaxID=1538125 RepID=A0AAV4QCA2_9ARAC|nr:hypothetical protein CDAR_123241 [Caerostris darwini]
MLAWLPASSVRRASISHSVMQAPDPAFLESASLAYLGFALKRGFLFLLWTSDSTSKNKKNLSHERKYRRTGAVSVQHLFSGTEGSSTFKTNDLSGIRRPFSFFSFFLFY